MTWEVATVILGVLGTVAVAILKLIPHRNGKAREHVPINDGRQIQAGEMSVEFWRNEFDRVSSEVKQTNKRLEELERRITEMMGR